MSQEQRTTEEQIEDLTVQLQSITEQLSLLKLQIKREKTEAARRTSRAQDRPGLQIGDQVVIKNAYQSLCGTTGTIIRLSTTFVTIRTNDGSEITRGTQNVKRIFNTNEV